MATLNNSDINLLVGLDFSRALATDVPRAAAQMEKLFNSAATFKKLSGPLGNISTSASEFAKSLEAANARVIAFGASVGVVYNIQKAFEKLVESTISVEKALTDIQVISNQSSKEIAKFGAELFRIGNQTGQTFENVSQAALEFSRQGLTVSETLKRTKDALILTRISGLDATKAVETLTAAVNSFGNGLLTTTQLVNKFVAVDTNFAVSSRDLAEAISRVGSTAEDSKVSLDELLGVVTAVQQSTARGGAVIGNAFKTIFTRLQRADTIEQLRELGVEIDNTQTGIQKLKAISETVKNADVTTAARIKELAAGVFQVNILSAALDDLSKSYGTYTAAQKTSESATDQAIQNNEKLNKSLASLLTRTQNNITQTFANIGNQSIESPFRKILEFLNKGLEFTNEQSGENIGKGLLNGLSKFIEGPGIAIAGNIALRLFGAFYSFSKDAFKQLTSLGEASKQRAAAEQAISNILQNQPQLLQAILSGERGVIGAQNEILLQLKQRLVLQEKIAAFARASAPLVGAAGMAINPDTRNIIRSKTASGGYVPKKDRIAESLGAMAGGYVPGNVKTMNINGLGKVVYNDAEKVQNFPGMSQPAIMPPQNSKAGKKYLQEFKGKHGFNPYIPNFSLKFTPDDFGGFNFDNKHGGGIIDIIGNTAEIGAFDTVKKGAGLSRVLYQDLFSFLRGKNVKNVKGLLVPQFDNPPREDTDLSRLKAFAPQIIRGRYGKSSILTIGKKTFRIPGGDQFDAYLSSKQKDIWSAMQYGGDMDYETFLNKGFVPNFLPIGMLKAYREVLGKIKNKQVNFFSQEEASKIWGPLKSAGGFYNPKDQSINISQDLKKSNWDLGFVAAHEGVHNIVDLLSKPEYKSKLKSPALRRGNIKTKLSDSGSKIYDRILMGESDPTYTFKRLNSSPDLYPDKMSSFLEESLADNSLAIIKDRRTLGFSDKTSYNFRKLFERLNRAGRNLSDYNPPVIPPHNIRGWGSAFGGFVPNFTKIKAAAYKTKKGNIFTGAYHGAAYEKIPQDEIFDIIDGFITDSGRFVNRKEAFLIAENASQLYKNDNVKKYSKLNNYKLDTAFLSLPQDNYFNSGFVPNFFAISDAISRESKSVPKSLIRIGQSSRLKSQGNPYGLGVYNLRDEPSGLNQGINRAYSEGLNPKSYGVPNFADGQFKLESKTLGSSYLDKVLRPKLNELLGSITQNKTSFDKLKTQLDNLIKESGLTAKSASSVRGIFRYAELKRPGTAGTMVSKQEDQRIRNLIRGGISGFSELARPQEIDNYQNISANFNNRGRQTLSNKLRNAIASFSRFAREEISPESLSYDQMVLQNTNNTFGAFGNTARFNKILSGAGGFRQFFERLSPESSAYEQRLRDFAALGNRSLNNKIRGSISGFSGFGNFNQSAREYLASTYTPPTSYEDLMGTGINKDKLKYAQRIQEIQQKVSTTRSFDIFGLAGQGKLFKELESIRKNYSDLIGKEDITQLKEVRSGKLQNVALGASFLIPMISETVKASLGDSESGRKTGAVVSSVGSVASLAATGFALGGGYGAAAGAGVGLLMEIPKLADELTTSIPELTKALERLQEQNNKSSQSVNQYISVSEQLQKIRQGEIRGVTSEQFRALRQTQQTSFFNLPKEQKNKLFESISSGNFSQARDIEFRLQQVQAQEQRVLSDKIRFEEQFKKSKFTPSKQANFGENILSYFESDSNIFLGRNRFTYRAQGERGQKLGQSVIESLTMLNDVNGKNFIDLLEKIPDALNGLTGEQQFNKIKEIGIGIKGFSELISASYDLVKDDTTARANYFAEFEKINQKIKENIAFQEEYQKALDKVVVSNQKLNDSFLDSVISLDKLKQKISSAFEIKNIRTESNFQRTNIIQESQARILGLNAGSRRSAELDSSLNRGKFVTDFQRGIKTSNDEFLNFSKTSILDSYNNLLTNFRENLQKEQISNKTEKFEEYKNILDSIFSSSGLDINNLGSASKEQIKSFINSSGGIAKQLESGRKGLQQSDAASISLALFDINRKYATAQQKLTNETEKYSEILRQSFSTQSTLDSAKTKEIDATVQNEIFQNKIRLENEKRLRSLGINQEINRTIFKQNTELGAIGLNPISRANFESIRALQEIRQAGKDELQTKVTSGLLKLREGKPASLAGDLNISTLEQLKKLAEQSGPFSAEKLDLIDEARKLYLELTKEARNLNDITEDQIKLQEINNKFLKEQARIRSTFSDKFASDNLSSIVDRLEKNNGGLTRKDVFSTIRNELSYNNATLQRDAILGVSEVTQTMKQSFSEATASIIKDGKDVGQAFKDVLLSVLNKITDRVSQMSTDLFFNGLTSLGKSVIGKNSGGIIRQYSTGGQVTGGSGVKDDVPALLTDGEYVINKRAVQKIGLKNLEKLNYGNEKEAILNLRNEFAYNDPKRPTKGYFNTDSNLSGFGLSDTEISRVNQLKFEREGQFYDYLAEKRDYDLNKSNAMAQFKAQKRNRLYGAYLNAFIGVAGAGLSSYAGSFTNSAGVSRSYLANARNAGVTINQSGIPNMNTGGIIQKFANGGHVFGGNTPTDNIPALLTGGEYVIKRDKVNKIGISTLDSLNYGNAKRFADGGLVGKQDAGISSFNSDIFNTLVLSINKLNDTLSSRKESTNSEQSGNTNNYISVSINIDSKGNVNSSNNSRTEGTNQNKNTNENNDRQNSEKLGRQLEAKMKAVVLDELRQGGSIYTFVNSKV